MSTKVKGSSDHYQRVIQFAKNIEGGLHLLKCIPHQTRVHLDFIEIVVEEFDSFVDEQVKEFYTEDDLLNVELALCNVNENLIRIQPSSKSVFGQALKNMRTLLAIGYERQTLLDSFKELQDVVTKLRAFMHQNNKKLKEMKLLVPETLKTAVSKDMQSTFSIFNSICDDIKTRKPTPELVKEVDTAIMYLEGALKDVSVEEAFDQQGMQRFENTIRRQIAIQESKLQPEDIFLNDKVIGTGIFGEVAVGQLNRERNGKKRVYVNVVVKSIDIDEEIMKDEFTEYSNELEIWASFPYENLVNMYGRVMDLENNQIHLVFERMEVDLERLNYEMSYPFDDEVHSRICQGIVNGLYQLHDLNLIHRNLKLANVFLDTDDPNFDEFTVKLGDFGLGLFKYELQTNGPTFTTPPEILKAAETNHHSFGWTTAGDMYSFAMVAYELGCRDKTEKPLQQMQYLLSLSVADRGMRPDLSKLNNVADWKKQIITSSWDANPSKRPTAEKILKKFVDRFGKDMPALKATVTKAKSTRHSLNFTVLSKEMAVEEGVQQMAVSIPDEEQVEMPQVPNVAGSMEDVLATVSNVKKLNSRIKALTDDTLSESSLDFDTNFIFSMKGKIKDVDCEAIGGILKYNRNCTRLSLEFNSITNNGLGPLAEHMADHPSMLHLFLGNNPKITRLMPLLQKLRHNEVLEMLVLSFCRLDNVAGAEIGMYLKEDPHLIQLDISENQINDEGLDSIAEGWKQNDHLRSLIVTNNKGRKAYKKLNKIAKKKGLKLNKVVIGYE